MVQMVSMQSANRLLSGATQKEYLQANRAIKKGVPEDFVLFPPIHPPAIILSCNAYTVCQRHVSKVILDLSNYDLFMWLNGPASITFVFTWVLFVKWGRYSFSNHCSLVNSQRSDQSDHDSRIWYPGSAASKQSLQSPPSFFSHRPCSTRLIRLFSFLPCSIWEPVRRLVQVCCTIVTRFDKHCQDKVLQTTCIF